MTDVLLAAAADGRGSWLLEIYGDAAVGRPVAVDGALRLLCDHAVRPASGLRAERRSDGEPARRAVTGAVRAPPSRDPSRP